MKEEQKKKKKKNRGNLFFFLIIILVVRKLSEQQTNKQTAEKRNSLSHTHTPTHTHNNGFISIWNCVNFFFFYSFCYRGRPCDCVFGYRTRHVFICWEVV